MVTDHQVLLFGSLVLSLFLLHRIWRVKQVWQAFGNLPAYSILVSPIDVISRLVPPIPRISDGKDFSWKNVYERQPLPRVWFSCSAHSTPSASRCLRSIQVRYCSTPVNFPMPCPTTTTRRYYSCQGGTGVKLVVFCAQFACLFRLSSTVVRDFLRSLETLKPFKRLHMVQVLLSPSTMNGGRIDELQGQASLRVITSSSGSRRSKLFLGTSSSGIVMGRGVLSRSLTSRR